MKIAFLSKLIAGGVVCFLSGGAAAYYLAKPIFDFAETAPLLILSEQTYVLKQLRSDSEREITQSLERMVWINISAHAQRLEQGKKPPETLQRDFAYHCDHLRGKAENISAEVYQTRLAWCVALRA